MPGELAFQAGFDHAEEVPLGRGQAQETEGAAREALQRADAGLRAGKAREAAADYEAALDTYLTAWARAEEDPQAAAALLREEVLLKTYPRSVEQLAPLVARRQDASAWRLLARVCEAKGDYDRALALLTDAIRAYPRDVASLSILARVSEKRDGAAAAVTWHQRVLEVNPKVRASRFFLARWYYARGQYGEALPHLERLFLTERHNRVCELYWLLANVHCYGVQGLEKRLAAVRHWQDLKADEVPLVHELFTLVGKQRLEEGELGLAERSLLHAYRLVPSQEGEKLLAEVGERKNDLAQRPHESDPLLGERRQAATDLDAFILSWATMLREEDRRKRLTLMKRIGLVAGVLLLGAGVIWASRQFQPTWQSLASREQIPFFGRGERAAASEKGMTFPPPSVAESGAYGEAAREQSLTSPPPVHERPVRPEAEEETPQAPQPYGEEPDRGKVVAAVELGMHVSGRGAKNPQRSPAAIQQAVEAYLPELQGAYAHARATDPLLLGSLVLDFTVEASGQVARVRLQSAKLDDRALREAVLAQVRTWRFPQASGAVRVSFPLLFVPPEVDAASVVTWEKYTALPKAEREKLSQAANTPDGGPMPQGGQDVKRPGIDRQKLAAMNPPGIYRVIAATPLRSEPRADAQVLRFLQPRMRVTVTGMRADYLEVRSVEGNPTSGYVYWGDVAFVYKAG